VTYFPLFRRSFIITLFVLAFVLGLSRRAVYAQSTTMVNTTAVANDKNDGKCDLWEALQAVVDYNNGSDIDGNGSIATYHECTTGAGPHFIVFGGAAAAGTISMNPALSPVLPWVSDDVTITGPVVIDGGGPTVDESIFHTNAGGKLTLVNLVVQNGYTSGGGGAILSLGSQDIVNIVGSSFHNNRAEGNGGAINIAGELNILTSNFSGNRALGLDANGSDYDGQGGAIYKSGYRPFNISLSNFAGNIATEGGGAIFNSSADSGEISDTVFNGNIVDDDAPNDET
jgi:predicted outer membrane repeat protein